MWPARFRWWHAALLTVLVVAGLLLAASWIAALVWGPALTRERVETLLSAALGQPAHVGAVRLSPWRLRLSLIDLDVPAAAAAPGGIGLRASAIHVTVDVASVWRRQLVVSARAVDVDFAMALSGTGAGTPAIFPLPEYFQAGPLRVGIGTLRVANGHALIRDPDSALTVEISGADVSGQPAAGDLDVSGQIKTLRVEALGLGEQFDRLELAGRLSADRVRVGELAWRWQGEPMKLLGEMRNPWTGAPELALRLQGVLPVAPVARAAGLDHPLTGKAQLVADLAGPAASPHVTGNVRVPELGIGGVSVRDVSLGGQWIDRKLRLDDVQARLGAGRLKGWLEVDPRKEGGAALALSLSELIVPGALAALGAGTASADGVVRDGGVDLRRGEASWRGLSLALDGRVASGRSLALDVTLTSDLRELARVMSWGQLSGRASMSAELSGRGATPALQGRVEVADLAAADQPPQNVRATFRMAAAHGTDTRWDGTIQSPGLRWSGVAIESVSASATVDDTRVDVTQLRARAAAVPVEAAGRWEWSGSGRGRATLGPVALGAVEGAPPSLRLGGTGRGTVDAAVDRGAASATARIETDKTSIAGVSLGDGRGDVRLRGRALEGELAFPDRKLRVTAAGKLEAGAALAGRVELDDLGFQPLLRELGAAAAADRVEGRVSVRAEWSMPIDQPQAARSVIRVTPDNLRLFDEPWNSQGPIVVRAEGDRLDVERFRLDGPSGSLSATGSLGGTGGRGLSIALDSARLPGQLSALGRGSAKADVKLDAGGFALTRFDAQWPKLTASASGHAQADGAIAFSGRADADLAGLGPALGFSGLGGRATLSADARGRTDAIEATGSLRAPRVEIRGAVLNDVDLPLRLARSSFRLERGRARLGASSAISAEASATWKGALPFDVESIRRDVQLGAEIGAPTARLEDVAPLLPEALRGRGELALAARAEGTPRAWKGTGTLTSPLLELGAGPVRQMRAAFALDQTGIEVTDFRADALGVPARGTASVGVGGRRPREGEPGACGPPLARIRSRGGGPGGDRARNRRGVDAHASGCRRHRPGGARRRGGRRHAARPRPARRVRQGRRVPRRAGIPRAVASAPPPARRPSRATCSPPRRRCPLSTSRRSSRGSPRRPPSSAARSPPAPPLACRSPIPAAARARSRSTRRASWWGARAGRAGPHPGALGARRVLARAVPARRQGRDRLRRGDGRGGRTARRQGHRQAVAGHAGRHPAGDPRDRRRAGSLAARVREASPRRRSSATGRSTAATCCCAIGRRRCATSRRASRCRARASSSRRPPARSAAGAWRRAAPSPFAAGSPAATGRRSRPGTSRRARSRGSRAPGTPTSS